jgi:hypothetical protein
MDAFTCKVYAFDKAPKKIKLLADKGIRPEPAQHVIDFPGGAIELSRTTDGDYWAHIIVNRKQMVDDCEGLFAAFGRIVEGRIDADDGVYHIPDHDNISQVALLIRPKAT